MCVCHDSTVKECPAVAAGPQAGRRGCCRPAASDAHLPACPPSMAAARAVPAASRAVVGAAAGASRLGVRLRCAGWKCDVISDDYTCGSLCTDLRGGAPRLGILRIGLQSIRDIWPSLAPVNGAFARLRFSESPPHPTPDPASVEYIPHLRRFLVSVWGEEYRAHLRAGGVHV